MKAEPGATEVFRDPRRPVDERVADLLRRMTRAEKAAQLGQRLPGWNIWSRTAAGRLKVEPILDEEAARRGGIGAIYGLQRADAWTGSDWSDGVRPEEGAELAALVQERVIASSRFGIPALMVEEAPHGHQALGGTVVPVPLALGSSWRPELAREAAARSASELRARGAHIALVSGLDLLRDPRWGRSEECYSESPYLAAQFVEATVRGIRDVPGVGAVLKHFAAQGAGIGGRNGSGAPIGPRELAEIHLPPAHAGVRAGAVGVMAAYNDIDGVPCVADRTLLTDVLRTRWGFDGFVMSDMFAIDRLQTSGATPAQSASLALRAGVDMSLCDEAFEHLEDAIERGLIDDTDLDLACGRVLGVKVRLGLLDPPSPAPSFPPPPDAAWARELAGAGAVLLSDRSALPLKANARVALLGPLASAPGALLGDYVAPQAEGVARSLRDAFAQRSPGLAAEPGCDLQTPLDGGIARAVAAAAAADVAVLVLGGTSERGYDDDFQSNGAGLPGESAFRATSGEGFDIAEVRLPAAQLSLARAVTATGVPTVAIVVSGRPHGLGDLVDSCAAVLWSAFPGPAGADVLVEIVYGEREPTGRLAASLPAASGTLPAASDERIETTSRYVDADAGAPLPLGAGLGWTSWELSEATPFTAHVATATDAGLEATLRNTGARGGVQLVQLYARAVVPGLTPRRAVLAGFARLAAAPGEEVPVRVGVDPLALEPLGDPRSGVLELWLSMEGSTVPESRVRVAVSG